MACVKYNLIAAACDNMGIGINGDLPWKLKNELKYFSRMTTKVCDPAKKNAVIMGRKTYFGVPESKRPLPGRVNIVLSKTLNQADLPNGVIVCRDLDSALSRLARTDFSNVIENVWIVGGSSVYKEAMERSNCHRLYFTEIKGIFNCDTYFPKIPDTFHVTELDEDIPRGIQEENGVRYEYKIYEKC